MSVKYMLHKGSSIFLVKIYVNDAKLFKAKKMFSSSPTENMPIFLTVSTV